MICPYNIRAKTEIQQWEQTPDENETSANGTTVARTVFKYMECKQSKCGAFYNGRCQYKKTNAD